MSDHNLSARAARRDGWSIAGLGLALRLVLVAWAWSRIGATADGDFYHQVAQRIASGLGYTWLWPDGVVTYAAHYPVGYPAMVAVPYALLGAHPGWAMLMNAVLGALACLAAHRLLLPSGRRSAALAALLVAIHPGLIAYTPALMTEGVVAVAWVCGAWLAQVAQLGADGDRADVASSRRRWLALAGCGLTVGAATLLRPQSILLAPLFGLASAGALRDRVRAVACVTGVALLLCAPWTLRNCERMGTCAFVSVNGGWNLLIGTQVEGNGAWSQIRVPERCREVYDEAGKDRCFGAAARERIVSAPLAWLALTPQKLNVTFDYCGAGPWYLHQSNPEAFTERDKAIWGTIETVFERLVLLLALIGAWLSAPKRDRHLARAIVLGLGVAFAVQRHASLAYGSLAVLLLWRRERSVLHVSAVGALVLVAVVHGVFFGAGRYQLVLWPLLCAVAAEGASHLLRQIRELLPPSPTATRTTR